MQLLGTLIALLCIAMASAAINGTDLNINDIKSRLPDGVTLPPELENLPSLEDATKVFREKCIKISGSDAAYEEASQATNNLMQCIQNLVNFTALPDEIEKAKPNGNLDTVFNKYCNKRSLALECVDEFILSLDPCLSAEEKDQKVVFVNITKSLLEFICYENGNQIALFIAEEGPECLSSKQDALQDCANKTLGHYFNDQMPTIENLPNLVIKDENCRDMDKLEKCVVKELETCKESTPANLVEALFKFVRKETPCGKLKDEGNASDRASLDTILGTAIVAATAKVLMSFR